MSFTRNTLAFAMALASGSTGCSGQTVRLPDLVAEAVANNREIAAARKQYEAARQRPAREGSFPDPTLSVGYASNGGPLPGQQLGTNPTSNIGVSITQEIPYPGKRKLRADIARRDAEAEFQQYQALQLSVRSRVTQAFHRLHHTYASIAILNQSKELLDGVIRASEARYIAGRTSQQEIFKAQTQLSMLQTRIILMEGERRTAEAELNSLLNRTAGSPVGEPAVSETRPLPISVEELLAKAVHNAPELIRDEKMIQRSELSVNLARQEFHSNYTVSAGYFNQGGMSPMYQLRVDVPIHLHSETQQRPALNEQVDLLAASRRSFEAAEQTLEFRVREAWVAAETAWRLMALYNDTILPQSQLTVDSALAAFQNGNADLAAVLNNTAAKTELEEQLHEQEMNFLIARARLEELTGVELR